MVVACGSDMRAARGGYMGDMSFLLDSAIGLTHLILAARAEGLGTCWVGLFDNDPIKELLEIPPSWNVAADTPRSPNGPNRGRERLSLRLSQ